MVQRSKDLEVVFSNMMKSSTDPQRIMVCLRFLALQAVAQGRADLAGDLESLLSKHEDDLDRPFEDRQFSHELH